MTTQYLLSQVDEEVCEKLIAYALECKLSRDCIVNEALKHYLSGRTTPHPAGNSVSARVAENVRTSVLK